MIKSLVKDLSKAYMLVEVNVNTGGKRMKLKKLLVASCLGIMMVTSVTACGSMKETQVEQPQLCIVIEGEDYEGQTLDKVLVDEYQASVDYGSYGATIMEIDGMKSDMTGTGDHKCWAIYEGDQYSMNSADKVVMQDGVNYKVQYETY